MRRKQLYLCTLLILLSTVSFSQNNSITGTWVGKYLLQEFDLGQPKLVVEIYDFKDSMFTGVTHLYYKGNLYEHYKMIGWYSKKDSLLVFMEASTIAVDLGIYGNCLGTYKTALKKEGGNLFQYGYWVSNKKGCSPTSEVWLQKQEEKPAPPEIKKTIEKPQPPTVVKKPITTNKPPVTTKPVVIQPVKDKSIQPVTTTTPAEIKVPARINNTPVPVKITQRQTDIQSLVEIAANEKDSIKVEVYDNGEIDGDTVSVYLENTALISKKMITAKPLTLYVSLDKNNNPIAHLRLVAESLGSIPPCTALMIVTTKTKRYEVHLSSNFNKNATVELFLKE